jgi:hypothetical protein
MKREEFTANIIELKAKDISAEELKHWLHNSGKVVNWPWKKSGWRSPVFPETPIYCCLRAAIP